MEEEHCSWLISQIERLVKNPDSANFGIDKSRCDLEIIIKVAEEDKRFITQEWLDAWKHELSVKTGVLSPVIYLEGNEPEWLAKGEFIH
jgi:hypothetical protein